MYVSCKTLGETYALMLRHSVLSFVSSRNQDRTVSANEKLERDDPIPLTSVQSSLRQKLIFLVIIELILLVQAAVAFINYNLASINYNPISSIVCLVGFTTETEEVSD